MISLKILQKSTGIILIVVFVTGCNAPEGTPNTSPTFPPSTFQPPPILAPPTRTPIVEVSGLPAGWKRFEGSGFEIWLPDTFIADTHESFAFNSDPTIYVNVLLQEESWLENVTLVDFVAVRIGTDINNGFDIQEKEPFSHPDFQGYKLLENKDVSAVYKYILKNGDRIWTIIYVFSVFDWAEVIGAMSMDTSVKSFAEK